MQAIQIEPYILFSCGRCGIQIRKLKIKLTIVLVSIISLIHFLFRVNHRHTQAALLVWRDTVFMSIVKELKGTLAADMDCVRSKDE